MKLNVCSKNQYNVGLCFKFFNLAPSRKDSPQSVGMKSVCGHSAWVCLLPNLSQPTLKQINSVCVGHARGANPWRRAYNSHSRHSRSVWTVNTPTFCPSIHSHDAPAPHPNPRCTHTNAHTTMPTTLSCLYTHRHMHANTIMQALSPTYSG